MKLLLPACVLFVFWILFRILVLAFAHSQAAGLLTSACIVFPVVFLLFRLGATE